MPYRELVLVVALCACRHPQSGPEAPVKSTEPDPSATVPAETSPSATVPAAATTVTVQLDQIVAIGGGVSMRFDGHSHKIMERGESPLMVTVTYQRDGAADEEGNYNLTIYPMKEAVWRWRGYVFKLVRFDYDKSMVLEVTRPAPGPPAAT